ncbi:MAG: PhoH family protein [Steroidobacteraceae bacterium]|nr:PhoH family protein [Steroidobacteraceae bacterium]
MARSAHEFELEPADNARLAGLCGPLDENLRLVESRLGVQIRRRGNVFRVSGEQADAAENVLRELYERDAGDDGATPEAVHLALRDRARDAGAGDRPLHPEVGGSADSHCEGASLRVPRGVIRARGRNQRDYVHSILGRDLTFGIGPAGTGKTYLAVACAVEALHADRVRRIVLVRPAVEAGERLGFLPGDLTQKVDPYLRPMYDALYEMMGFDRVARFIERNVIEVAPLAFMRGRSLNDSFVILDEAQNTTIEQMKMFLTRIGFGSKAVVTGDVTQTDLPSGKLSGLRHVIDVVRGVEGVAFTFFDSQDVVRHPLVQRIVQAYEARGDETGRGER